MNALPTITSTGERIVRLRQTTVPMGIFGLRLWVVTDAHGRKPLGPKHFTRALAAAYATEQGWRYLGTQE